jgi:hypothetical protein
MKLLGLAFLSMGILAPALALAGDAAKTFPGIEALMTGEEYQAAGLDKLTPGERGALNRWLIRYTAEDSQLLRTHDEEVIKAVEEQEILSVILPPFNGWTGKTIFKLENGQVWQQRRQGNYPYRGSSPQVRISKNIMGFFRMELLENGKSVQVKRLK